MDLTNIIIISFILSLLILAPHFMKRAYYRYRCERIIKEYRESCERYSGASSTEEKILPNNVIDLREYKERKYEKLL